MRLWHLLYEVLTETTLAQLILSSYPRPNSMLYPRGTDRNSSLILTQYKVYLLLLYLSLSCNIRT